MTGKDWTKIYQDMSPFPFHSEGDNRGLFPVPIRAQGPLGIREKIYAAAKKQGISYGEFVRRALVEAIERAEEDNA